ncbi:MAG: MBL fold metallo-hydrolase, partial [Muribaculaceae bacterium]|nr:MBL fold metallo-hydrolase [Muribaculaceae bacterium]
MARSKKSSSINLGQPSLFDSYDLFGTTADEPQLQGLDHHIRLAQEKLAARRESTIKPLGDITADRRVLFISFGSGSSGNSCYVGTRTEGLLIDAGVDHKKIEAEMTRNGMDMTVIKGIILTHDHGDHVRYAYALLRTNRHLALYCTPRVLNGILRRHNVSRRIKDYHRAIYKEIPFTLGGFEITAFEVDHDGSDNMGFFITSLGFSFAVATDLGHIGERVDHYMRRATHIMIESNYDLTMLMRGHYPEYLKA